MIGNLPLSGRVIRAIPTLKMISAFMELDHVAVDVCR